MKDRSYFNLTNIIPLVKEAIESFSGTENDAEEINLILRIMNHSEKDLLTLDLAEKDKKEILELLQFKPTIDRLFRIKAFW